jgi:DNA helicase IV
VSARTAEIAIEQRHVDRVYDRLETLRTEAQRARRDGHRIAGARTPGSLVERDAMVHHAAARIRALDAEYEGLVFGRLDLTTGEARRVGRLGLRDANQETLVVDWRAPGAAPFYQATTEEPMGVVRRRVIRSSGSTVIDVSDDLLDSSAPAAGVAVVGDGALLATLARARTAHMRDIVATIQKEQDQAIRSEATGVTLIEGGPGTGKTAVALHRAAHLLYRDRRRFEGGGVLLVGPSSVFMSYVERVLPSLGEDTAELRALGSVLDDVRAERLDPPAVAALKGSARMRTLLAHAVREAPPDAPTELRISYGGQVLRLGVQHLDRARRNLDQRVQVINSGGAEARRGLVAALWLVRPEGVSWTTSSFAAELYDRDEFERFAQAWWPVTTPIQALGWLRDPERVYRAGRGWLDVVQAEALAASWAGLPGDVSVADVAVLDELRVLLGAPPKPARKRRVERGIDEAGDDLRELSTVADRYYAPRERQGRPADYDGYAHVLVDEAQDLSPMQWRMLGRRGQQASWTIVGDAAQSAWPDPAEAARARDDALRGKQVRRFHLTTNYRNSAEIFELAADVVRAAFPEADLPHAVRRTGEQPTTVHTDDLDVSVVVLTRDLVASVEGTVGVVTPAARRADVAALLTSMDADRVTVVDAMRAKGMEYDGVLVVAPEEIAAESAAGIRVLYVALTRATQRLITVSATGWPLSK